MDTQKTWKKLKPSLVVVFITVFIWLVADRYVSDARLFQITVRLNTHSPDRYVSLAEAPFQIRLNVTVEGRRRHLEEFENLVRSTNCFEAFIDDARVPSPEPQVLSVEADVLYKIAAIRDRLTVKTVSPATVHAIIDN